MPRKTITLPTPLATTLARRFQPVPHSYTERDASLYALAVGAAADAAAGAGTSSTSPSSSLSSSASASELRFVFDGAAGFAPLPTFPCTFPYFGVTAAVSFEEILPNFNPVSSRGFSLLSGLASFCKTNLSLLSSAPRSLAALTISRILPLILD